MLEMVDVTLGRLTQVGSTPTSSPTSGVVPVVTNSPATNLDPHGWWANLLQGSLGSLVAATTGALISLWIARHVLVRTLAQQRTLTGEQLAAQREELERQIAADRELANRERLEARAEARESASRKAARDLIDEITGWRMYVSDREGTPVPAVQLAAKCVQVGERLVFLSTPLRDRHLVKACHRLSLVVGSYGNALMHVAGGGGPDRQVREAEAQLPKVLAYSVEIMDMLALHIGGFDSKVIPGIHPELLAFLTETGALDSHHDAFID
jgi:hypothetical protein